MERFSTQVPGLDEVLHGGLPAHSTILISGVPGSGKTVLSAQIVYRNATVQQKGVIISTASEPLSRILRYTQEFTFFDHDLIGTAILYEDLGPHLMAGDGAKAIARVEELLLEYKPAFLVLDSFRALRELSETGAAARRGLYRLVALLATLPCTALLVGEYQPHEFGATVEASLADGILHLDRRPLSLRDRRTIRVYKLRGSDYIAGEHSFRITADGIVVFPRFLTPAEPMVYTARRDYAPTGIQGMDTELLHGGLPRGTTTLVAGDPGVGKTVTALHFLLNGARQGEPGAYISFQEDPNQLAHIAHNFGFNVHDLVAQGKLAMLYTSPVELDIDEHVQKMLKVVQSINARRVVIDSIGDLEAGTRGDPDRFFNFVYSLVQWFKNRDITAVLIAEMGNLFAGELTLTGRGVSHIADSIILLRYTEIHGEIRRAIAVLSVRGSDHSKQVREYLITEVEGPRIGPPLTGAFSVFTPTQRRE